MVLGRNTEPARAFNFRLEISGIDMGSFRAATGLGVSIEVIRFREAGNKQVVRHLPGQVTYEPVTLHYGFVKPKRDIFNWLMQPLSGVVERRSVSIIQLDNAGAEVLRYNLFNSWVAAWRGAQLDSLGQEVAIETITLVYDSIELGGA